MSRGELREAGARLVAAARAVRAGFPDAGAMRRVGLGDRPVVPCPGDPDAARARAALGFLWDEAVLVRDGRSADVTVLDDEIRQAVVHLARL